MLGAVLKTLRPHQWVKNSFVAIPLVFAKHLGDADYVVRTLVAVLAFCALSGAVARIPTSRNGGAGHERCP
jgi:decaprenyl-phosphate phosphoribosyltransferase